MPPYQQPRAWDTVMVDSVRNLGIQIADVLPRLFGALLVLILGWLLASVLGGLVHKLVIWSQIDTLLRKTATPERLNAVGMKSTIADVAGTLVKWFVLLFVFSAAADILDWDQVTNFLNTLIAYLPNVAVAVLLLVGGYLLGTFLSTLVTGTSQTITGVSSSVVAGVVKWAIVIFATMAALIQLGIAESLIHIAFTGFVAMLTIAGGLAFGLGGQERAREVLQEMKRPSGM
jgi:hypothetical protein